MQNLFRKNSNLNTTIMGPCIDGSSSWLASTESRMQESTMSRNLSIKVMNTREHCQTSKQLGASFQDQESSSTQSSGQSHSEVASMETKEYGRLVSSSDVCLSTSLGSCITNIKADEDQGKSAMAFQDHGLPHSPIDYRQLACFPSPYPNPYHCGFSYGPFPVVHSQMMGMTANRVPLPLDSPNNEPIYVNAKQYRAILRRRQFRAKLEAENKLSKVRKPYLHESRHRHALNRVRGSGGRFLNTKKPQESKPASKMHGSGEDVSGSMPLQSNTKAMVSELHQAENEKNGNSNSTCFDITSNSNDTFKPQEFRFSVYPSHSGGKIAAGGAGMVNGTQQYLSVYR